MLLQFPRPKLRMRRAMLPSGSRSIVSSMKFAVEFGTLPGRCSTSSA